MNFTEELFRFNGIAMGWDVCDGEIILDPIKRPQRLRFLNCRWRNDEEFASGALQLYPEDFLHIDYKCSYFRNRMVKKNKVLQTTH